MLLPTSRRLSAWRRTRSRLAAALFFVHVGFLAGPAQVFAQIAPSALTPVQEPEFQVETIRIEGLEHGPEAAIRNQSLLIEGGRYGEEALRRAIHRVRRLPFVYDANMRLERGSQRGHHVLVIQVVEAHRFFSRFELRYVNFTLANDGPFLSSNTVDVPDSAIGVRTFLGANGVLFAGLDDDEGGFVAGYTQYNLFGTRARATFTLRRGFCCGDEESGDETFGRRLDDDFVRLDEYTGASVLLSMPIRGNHSLQFEATHVRQDEAERIFLFEPMGNDGSEPGSPNPFAPYDPFGDFVVVGYPLETRLTVLQSSWAFDTRDDVFLPRTGIRAEAGARFTDTLLRLSDPTTPVPGIDLPSAESLRSIIGDGGEQFDIFAEATRHWQVGRSTWTTGAEVVYSDLSSNSFASNATFIAAELGYALPLFESKFEEGRFRFETRWRHRWVDFGRRDSPLVPGFGDDSPDDGFAYAGFAFRNRWTVLRLGASITYGLDR